MKQKGGAMVDSEVFELNLQMGGSHVYMNMVRNLHETSLHWDSSGHEHPSFELHVLLRGSATVDIGGQLMTLQSPQAILIGPGQYHRPVRTSKPFERISMEISVADGPLLRDLRQQARPCRILQPDSEMLELCRSMVEECAATKPFRETVVSSRMTLLLADCLRLMELSVDDKPIPQRPLSTYSDRIDAWFEHCLPDGDNLDDLAAQLHLSRSQTCRILKKLYGMTFREKLVRTRMEHAAWLLRHSDRRIGDIAADTGYASESRFYQTFRERFGLTPENYRVQYRRNDP